MHLPFRVTLAWFLLCGVTGAPSLGGCGGGDPGEQSTEETTTEAATAEAVVEPPPPEHWPRPIPPELYRTAAVDTPGSLHGTITAAVDSHGVLFDASEDPACPAEPVRFAVGPLPGAVLLLEGIEAGAPLVPADADVALGGCEAEPRVQVATVGGVVRASARDGQTHDLQMILWDGYRDLGRLTLAADGTEVQRRLRLPGLLHLRCDEHPAARGWVWVMEHPYHALSGADGTYRIGDIPPGRYVLHVWHEGYEPLVREVDVLADGDQTLDLVLGSP
jgi:hypothetical protein